MLNLPKIYAFADKLYEFSYFFVEMKVYVLLFMGFWNIIRIIKKYINMPLM